MNTHSAPQLITRTLLSSLLLLTCTPLALTQPPASPPAANARAPLTSPKPADRNAALRYLTIASSNSDLLLTVELANMSDTTFDRARMPAEFKAAFDALEGNKNRLIEQTIEATKLPRCDFEIAWEQGPFLQLPHLNKMRSLARALRVDARRLTIAGDPDAAAARLAAMVRLGGHTTEDGIIISSLVGAAMVDRAIDETEAMLDAGKSTASSRKTILAALDQLDAADPFAMKRAISLESRSTVDWVRDNFKGPEAGKKLIESGVLDIDEAPTDDQVATKAIETARKDLAAMNQQQLAAAADRAAAFNPACLAAWDKPGADEELKALNKRVSTGDFGPVARILACDIVKVRGITLKSIQRLAAVKKKLADAK